MYASDFDYSVKPTVKKKFLGFFYAYETYEKFLNCVVVRNTVLHRKPTDEGAVASTSASCIGSGISAIWYSI